MCILLKFLIQELEIYFASLLLDLRSLFGLEHSALLFSIQQKKSK